MFAKQLMYNLELSYRPHESESFNTRQYGEVHPHELFSNCHRILMAVVVYGAEVWKSFAQLQEKSYFSLFRCGLEAMMP